MLSKQSNIGKIIKDVIMTKTRSYESDLLKALTDPIEAKEYLNAALEDEDPEVFLLALKDVVEANNTTCGSAQAIKSDRGGENFRRAMEN